MNQDNIKEVYIESSELVYKGLCILESYSKNEGIFYRLLGKLTYSYDFFLISNRNNTQNFKKIHRLKEKIYQKLIFTLKDDLFNKKFIHNNCSLDAIIVRGLNFFYLILKPF